MIKKVLLIVLLVVGLAAPVLAHGIEGEYRVKVKGSNIFMDRSPARERITDETSLKVQQDGDMVSFTFGAFGGVSPATIFKGKADKDHFAAVWWYRGSAHETKVIWGVIRNSKLHGRMIYPRVADHAGQVPGWVEIEFMATPKHTQPLKPVDPNIRKREPVVHAPGERIHLKEDCLSFDHTALIVKAESGHYLLTDGRSRMKMFANRPEAQSALKIIQQYGMDQLCFVGRPNPSMEYWLAGDRAPNGRLDQEDCIGFDPRDLKLKREGDQWLMTDGRSRMHMFPSRTEAEQALAVIRKYGFTQTCYVGRPDPAMTYFK